MKINLNYIKIFKGNCYISLVKSSVVKVGKIRGYTGILIE